MDWLQFASTIFVAITSLAWPAAFFAVAWIFRKELRALLPKLRLKHGETELSFINKLEDKVDELLADRTETGTSTIEGAPVDKSPMSQSVAIKTVKKAFALSRYDVVEGEIIAAALEAGADPTLFDGHDRLLVAARFLLANGSVQGSGANLMIALHRAQGVLSTTDIGDPDIDIAVERLNNAIVDHDRARVASWSTPTISASQRLGL